MQRPVFRKVAVGRLSSPDQLDHLMRVTTPMAWLALLAAGAVLIVALFWSIFGSIPTKLQGQGILIHGGGVNAIDAPASGQFHLDERVALGLRVTPGQVVGHITAGGVPTPTVVFSPYAGRVIELAVDEDSLVDRGTRLLSLVDDSQPLEAVIYMPSTDGRKIYPGMAVEVSPSTIAKEEYGFMPGVVSAVGQFPATYEGMFRVLKNDDLVTALRAGGAPIEVRVALQANDSVSGYAWSSPRGPNVAIENGTLASAAITIEQRQPLSLILPILNR